MKSIMLSVMVMALTVAVSYPAAEPHKNVAVLTIASIVIGGERKSAESVLFCSTEDEQENPETYLHDALSINDSSTWRYKWLLGSKTGSIAGRIKVELLQPGRHIRARMGHGSERILDTLGTVDKLAHAVVLGGHNPYKPGRVVIDYQAWLQAIARDAGTSADVPSMPAPRVPLFEQILGEVKSYAEDASQGLMAQHEVTQAIIRARVGEEVAMRSLLSVLNLPRLSAGNITAVLKKCIRITPAIIGIRLQLDCAAGIVMFDAYRAYGRIRIAACHKGKPNASIRKHAYSADQC